MQVWGEALRNPEVARRFGDLLGQVRADLADIVAAHQASGRLASGVDPAGVATMLISTIAGHILQTALFGSEVSAGVPEVARALWPA